MFFLSIFCQEHGPVQVRYADGERERHGINMFYFAAW